MSKNAVEKTSAFESLIPVETARRQILRKGRPVSKSTVFSLGACRELDIRRVAGRYVVTAESLRRYKARNGEVDGETRRR